MATAAGDKKKKVAVFDPEAGSRAVIVPLLERLGYQVEVNTTATGLSARLRGRARPDLVFLHLLVFGDSYQRVLDGLKAAGPFEALLPPVLAVSSLNLSQEARVKLESLGCSAVVSRQAPLLEVMFAINRLLFPKIRELRRYTRVFGGFPVEFEFGRSASQGVVYNISREGAFIQTDSPAPDGSRLRLRFQLPGGPLPLEVDALVNWVNSPEDVADPLSPPGMGINFLTLGAEGSTSLEKFITDRAGG